MRNCHQDSLCLDATHLIQLIPSWCEDNTQQTHQRRRGEQQAKIQQPTNEKTQESKTKSKTQTNTFPIYIYIYTPIILYPVMADSVHLFVLLECAAGYALFDVYAMEEI